MYSKPENYVLLFIFMEIKTHLSADKSLLGNPVKIIDGKLAIVELAISENMVVDDKGLVHGGFTFGLADYAAMLAINDPNVVIGEAKIKFIAPVKRGDVMIAKALVTCEVKSKRLVNVDVSVENNIVLKGELTCFILRKHVLS
jgi:acyl-coenzyme A thioesterase PaaI-like protein